MTRKRKPGAQRKTGNKSPFTNKMLEQVTLLTKLGATEIQLASFFDVNKQTITNWKKKEDFKQAALAGGLEADMKVVASLYQRAVGFTYEETESIRSMKGDFLTKVSKKFCIPETKAIIHWLRNRQRDNWTVAQDMNHSHSGKIEHIHNRLEDIPVNELTKDAQNMLFEITSKQLSNANRDN